jgi:predicted Fe-S protein YdhL (DUF1289 family)
MARGAALSEIASPCVRICALDAASGLCAGCYRTAREIGRWPLADDAEKRAILHAVAARRAQAWATGSQAPLTAERCSAAATSSIAQPSTKSG